MMKPIRIIILLVFFLILFKTPYISISYPSETLGEDKQEWIRVE